MEPTVIEKSRRTCKTPHRGGLLQRSSNNNEAARGPPWIEGPARSTGRLRDYYGLASRRFAARW